MQRDQLMDGDAGPAKEMSLRRTDVRAQFPHYHKRISGLEYLDVYRVLQLFDVADPCIQHAVKKLLVAGGRGDKNISQDVKEAIASLTRWQQMREEETGNHGV